MDLVPIHFVFSLVSAVMQMAATILVLSCVVNFFSLRPEGSLRMVYIGLFYFFGSSFFFFVGALWLMDQGVEFNMFMGISAFVEALLIHLVYGSLVAVLYSGIIYSRTAHLAAWVQNKRPNRSGRSAKKLS